MLVNHRITIRNALIGALVLTVLLLCYFASISLVAFPKVVMIRKVDLILAEAAGVQEPDIRKLLQPIPYQNGASIFDVLPSDRFHKTIEQGYGNCSNLVMGMAYLLLQHDYAFQVIHLLSYDGFLNGKGHTVLNMPYRLDGATHVGLVDMLEGGLPQMEGKLVDLPTLRQRRLTQPSILPLNQHKDNQSIYYGDFLNSAAIGVVPREEVVRYFRFVERFHVPLGSKRLERLVYVGAAIVLGRYPHTYVGSEDYSRLFAGRSYLVWAAQALLWLLRVVPLLTALFLLSYVRLSKLPRIPEGDAASTVAKSGN